MSAPGASAQQPSRLLDVASVVTVVPLLFAAGQMVKAAWRSYHPERRPVRQTPASFGLAAEQVTVTGADGVAIACWIVPAPGDSDVVVVMGHGIGRDSGMLMTTVKAVHDAGYHVATFDLRNHGNSADDGRLRGQSPRYAIDHQRVVQHVRERFAPRDVGVACLGFSMSAWTSIAVARLEPQTVRAVIADSGPTLDIIETMGRMFDATKGRLPRFMRGPLMAAASRAVFTRASRFFLQPTTWPQEIDGDIRLLLVGGEADPVARPEDLRALLDSYPQAQFWFVPGAGHMQAHMLAADEYTKRVVAVIEDAFPPDKT